MPKTAPAPAPASTSLAVAVADGGLDAIVAKIRNAIGTNRRFNSYISQDLYHLLIHVVAKHCSVEDVKSIAVLNTTLYTCSLILDQEIPIAVIQYYEQLRGRGAWDPSAQSVVAITNMLHDMADSGDLQHLGVPPKTRISNRCIRSVVLNIAACMYMSRRSGQENLVYAFADLEREHPTIAHKLRANLHDPRVIQHDFDQELGYDTSRVTQENKLARKLVDAL